MRKLLYIGLLVAVGLVLGAELAHRHRNQPNTSGTSLPSPVPEASRFPTPYPSPQQTNKFLPSSKPPPVDAVWEMLQQVHQDRLLADLRRLTGEEPICTEGGCYTITDRATGGRGLQWAKDYVREELLLLGYSVEVQDWARSGRADQNVIARKPGGLLAGEQIYLVAHLDGVDPKSGGRRPAADDNASGVVDLLELARVLRNQPLDRTVVLLFSTGEEKGTLGVRSHLDRLSAQELQDIKYVVDVDMVGYDSDLDGAMQLWPGEHAPSLLLARRLNATINAYQLHLLPAVVTGCT